MTNQNLLALESKLDQLILMCDRLHQENITLLKQASNLREREASWMAERSKLIEKNDLARNRVEAMISRLKSLEEQA